MIEEYIGSTILVEIRVKKKTPFGSTSESDADSLPTCTVTDPIKAVKVDAAEMTNSGTGLYYYMINTAAGWVTGYYNVKINLMIDSNAKVEKLEKAFVLK